LIRAREVRLDLQALLASALIVFSAAVVVPMWNLQALIIDNYPAGPFMLLAMGSFLFCVYLSLLVVSVYVGVKLAMRDIHDA
jgi:hypothetical protein